MLYYHFIKSLLKLPEQFSVSIQESANHPVIIVTQQRTTQLCPSCGTSTNLVHDYRAQKVRDIPLQQEAFSLVFRKRRYVCPHCSKRFYEENPFLTHYQRQTNRHRLHILAALSEQRTIRSIANEFFCSPGVIRRIMKQIHYPKPTQLPRVLAIDEFKGNVGDKFQCLLVDPENKTVLDVLPNKNSEALYAYFNAYPKEVRNQVNYIVMDLSTQFSSVMRACFPKAEIVADKFHVVRLINWALEKVRKEEQKKFHSHRRKYFKRSRTLLLLHKAKLNAAQKEQLALMLEVSPRIRMAYGLKELFYEMMQGRTEREVQERYKRFLNHAMEANIDVFQKHIPTIHKWFHAILLGILTGYTNGFIEGCNNRTKVLKRLSYGLRNFDLFRNRLLHIANNTTQRSRARL